MTEPTTSAILPIELAPLALAAQAADRAAARNLFADYRARKAKATVASQDDDLARFAAYLAEAGVQAGDLATAPEDWSGMTWGIVSGFVRWQLSHGYAVTSINRALSTIKGYAKLAAQAGALDPSGYMLIKAVSGYSVKEAKRLDASREQTRAGHKKAQHTPITTAQARALKSQPDTPQGRRDRLILCLLLDHGLRVGELAGLTVEEFDLEAGTFRFYRPKVDKIQTHQLTADTLRAARAYFAHDAPAHGSLLRGSRKGGELEGGMSVRAIRERVKLHGEAIGLPNLGPHDLRHYWATGAARNKTDPFALQEAGCWSSLAMPRRYIETAAIANQGVKLSG